MWVGCYTLDLYCDNYINNPSVTEYTNGYVSDKLGHRMGEFPHQYTHELGAKCRSRARRDGWVFARDGTTICPTCSKKLKLKEQK